jgi:hypothetical protein
METSTILDTSTFVSNIPTDKPFYNSIGDFLERKNFLSVVKDVDLLILI